MVHPDDQMLHSSCTPDVTIQTSRLITNVPTKYTIHISTNVLIIETNPSLISLLFMPFYMRRIVVVYNIPIEQ